jgi:segregation and condensation protein B
MPDVPPEEIKRGIQQLLDLYGEEGRGLQIVQVAGGYQITTRPEYHDRVGSMFKFKPPKKLTIQALETLAAIAYRQPITGPEIMELRGVRSAGVMRTLLEKKLIRILGRKNVVGRPIVYGTTKEFLLRFGLKDLSELPRLEDMAEVFGEDVALQLEDTVGGAQPSVIDAAGPGNGSSLDGAATDEESVVPDDTARDGVEDSPEPEVEGRNEDESEPNRSE